MLNVARTQMKLKAEDYYKGKIDGMWGERTEIAFRDREKGKKPGTTSKELDPETPPKTSDLPEDLRRQFEIDSEIDAFANEEKYSMKDARDRRRSDRRLARDARKHLERGERGTARREDRLARQDAFREFASIYKNGGIFYPKFQYGGPLPGSGPNRNPFVASDPLQDMITPRLVGNRPYVDPIRADREGYTHPFKRMPHAAPVYNSYEGPNYVERLPSVEGPVDYKGVEPYRLPYPDVPGPTNNASRRAAESAYIRSLQQKMAADGRYRGQIDGDWGPKSKGAYGSYRDINKGDLNSINYEAEGSFSPVAPVRPIDRGFDLPIDGPGAQAKKDSIQSRGIIYQ